MKIKKKLKSLINKIVKKVYKKIYKYIPVDDKTVLFVAFHGRGYLCNPKYIHEYMINSEEYKKYNFIWALKKNEFLDIKGAKVIKYNGIKYLYYLARSKYLVSNCKLPRYIIKKEEQVYLQTWHGTPLKKLAHDINIDDNATFYRTEVSKQEMTDSYDYDVNRYDYLISPNKFSSEKFLTAFKINKDKIIETGYPRNDFLSTISVKEIDKLKEKFNLPKDKKVILYAPTWRDNSYNNKGYIFNLEVNFDLWREYLGDEYVVIFKPHYLIVNKFKEKNLSGFLFNVSENEDINELYAISDMLITDYSSVFFDYSILKKPILFYMYDMEEYKENLRGFYLNIYEDLPGPIITDEYELLSRVKSISKENHSFNEIIDKFNDRFNYLEDGNSTKRVLDKVFN
ncbi:MAG: CDP-glycerol glycerophosphotransferase family protein [Clostridium sp.]